MLKNIYPQISGTPVRVADKVDPKAGIAPGETIHTEISRKFTRSGLEDTLRRNAFELERWFEAGDATFALALARAR